MEQHLNIISFDIPFPPDYGGAIDVFFKIKALFEAGVKIHLHCFIYGDRNEVEQLNDYCESIHYYQRKLAFNFVLSRLPFIVRSRVTKDLLSNLLKNDYPILFEGLHTTYYLNHADLRNRLKIVRMHNIEHNYYKHLAKKENNLFKKVYFSIESIKLRQYENILKFAAHILAISRSDYNNLSSKFNTVKYISAFHGNNKISGTQGRGSFILYHGNLSVSENIEAVDFILQNICRHCNYNFIIAGKNPEKELKRKIEKNKNVTLIENPSSDVLLDLIRHAQINLLLTFQNTGLKLKLLHSLYNGKFCLANNAMVESTGLESLCTIKNRSHEIITEIKVLMEQDFNESEIEKRLKILNEEFSNEKNAKMISELLITLQS